jgi:hypothetical protein
MKADTPGKGMLDDGNGGGGWAGGRGGGDGDGGGEREGEGGLRVGDEILYIDGQDVRG